MKVWRWEHGELGYGPLCGETGDFLWEDLFYPHLDPEHCPRYTEYVSSLSFKDRKGHFFGANSKSGICKLMKKGTGRKLQECGFHLCIYEVHEDFVVLSDGQVFFKKAKAVLTT